MNGIQETNKQRCLRFLKLWLFGFTNPWAFANGVKNGPAPWFGLAGRSVQGVAAALALFMPLAIAGTMPSVKSWLSFVPTAQYYAAMIGLTPVVYLIQLLAGCAAMHTMLRFAGLRNDFDVVININGMAAMTTGIAMIAADWLYLALGLTNGTVLGIIHLAFYGWAAWLSSYALKKIFGVSIRFGLLANLVYLVFSLPLGIVFLRLPV
jgi:hypothetical protein